MKSEDSLRDFRGHHWTHARITVVQEERYRKGQQGYLHSYWLQNTTLIRKRHSRSGILKALRKRTPRRPDTKMYSNQLVTSERVAENLKSSKRKQLVQTSSTILSESVAEQEGSGTTETKC